jgi:hypothetical protein
MTTREQVFVAYPGQDPALATGIVGAVRKANARPIPIVFEPWPFNDVFPVGNSILLATDIESSDAPALCETFVA